MVLQTLHSGCFWLCCSLPPKVAEVWSGTIACAALPCSSIAGQQAEVSHGCFSLSYNCKAPATVCLHSEPRQLLSALGSTTCQTLPTPWLHSLHRLGAFPDTGHNCRQPGQQHSYQQQCGLGLAGPGRRSRRGVAACELCCPSICSRGRVIMCGLSLLLRVCKSGLRHVQRSCCGRTALRGGSAVPPSLVQS